MLQTANTSSVLIVEQQQSSISVDRTAMAKTSLPFYRKNQSLHDMESERPKHMAALREAVISATAEVRNVTRSERPSSALRRR